MKRGLIAFVILLASVNIFAQETSILPISNIQKVEILYKNGGLSNYIDNNIRIPVYANGIIRYKVSFTVTKDSTSSNVEIEDLYKMNCTPCEDSLRKVLNEMPKWKPAIKDSIYFPLEISFILKINLVD